MRRTLPLNVLFLAVITPVIVLSTAGFGYAAYVRLYATILEGFDRKLAALSSATSVYINPDDTLALLAQKDAIKARGEDPEQHPIYVKYVVPMRQVRERAGLTYLYTQLLLPGTERKCVYLLDGTVGEGHSEFGEEDSLPEEDWPVALRVVHDGDVAQTAIREWEQWGLLKCGWAPMYGADGTVKAMAGADVEITIIRQKTYVALLQTLGVGALALLLASIVSVRVARKLTHPLGEVREAALRIASGNYGARCRIDSPREMNTLAQTLNSLAHMMETAVGEARPRMDAWRRQRAEQALVEVLALRPHRTPELAMAVLAGAPTASGFAVDGDLALLWHGITEDDQLAASRRAREIEHVARALLKKHGATAGDMLLGLMSERIDGCALIDRQDWSVRLTGKRFAIHGEGIDAAGRETVTMSPGRTIVIASVPVGATPQPSPGTSPSAPAALDAVTAANSDGGVVAAVHRPARHGRGHAA
jgi:HAMP domain-containing protein